MLRWVSGFGCILMAAELFRVHLVRALHTVVSSSLVYEAMGVGGLGRFGHFGSKDWMDKMGKPFLSAIFDPDCMRATLAALLLLEVSWSSKLVSLLIPILSLESFSRLWGVTRCSVCMYVCMYACMHVCVCVCACICMYSSVFIFVVGFGFGEPRKHRALCWSRRCLEMPECVWESASIRPEREIRHTHRHTV